MNHFCLKIMFSEAQHAISEFYHFLGVGKNFRLLMQSCCFFEASSERSEATKSLLFRVY